MADRINVSFACNDPDNGMFAGECEQVQFDDFDGDNAVTVEATGGPVAFKWIELRGDRGYVRRVQLGTRTLGVSFDVGDHKPCQGNWCWDGCSMTLGDARALLSWLLAHGFEATEWTLEGPFADLVEHATGVVREAVSRG